jgi:hypothetical protein
MWREEQGGRIKETGRGRETAQRREGGRHLRKTGKTHTPAQFLWAILCLQQSCNLAIASAMTQEEGEWC